MRRPVGTFPLRGAGLDATLSVVKASTPQNRSGRGSRMLRFSKASRRREVNVVEAVRQMPDLVGRLQLSDTITLVVVVVDESILAEVRPAIQTAACIALWRAVDKVAVPIVRTGQIDGFAIVGGAELGGVACAPVQDPLPAAKPEPPRQLSLVPTAAVA